MKTILLTWHAELRMQERRLRYEWVEAAIRDPQWNAPDPGDVSAERRFRAIDEADGRVLRVVCVETETTIRVLTATFDRRARRDR